MGKNKLNDYQRLYAALGVIFVLLIFNTWCSFLKDMDAAMVGVYAGLVTATMLIMKKSSNDTMYKVARIASWVVIAFIIIFCVASCSLGGIFKAESFIMKAIRTAGFIATIGTFMINWKL